MTNASQDLFADGTVILLPAFGRSLGFMGGFVNIEERKFSKKIVAI
jgi:hypothetical protein